MPSDKINLAVLISGRGSNLHALIKACKSDDFPARIVLVVSNNPDARGLEYAKNENIKTAIIEHKKFKEREAFDREVDRILRAENVDIICLAGFMRVLSKWFVQNWPQRIVNIHPSLLPDYKGLNTHKRVLEDKKEVSGCTVHYVTEKLDDGPIILQKKVKVEKNDSEGDLAARVLVAEHNAYPEAIKIIAENYAKKPLKY
jgi:phosphoribosylglycinamide formyltransferase-1